MNKMPAIPSVVVDRYLKPCQPYLAKCNDDGEVNTVIRVGGQILYISDTNTSQSGEDYFWDNYTVVRQFTRDVDSVTIANW